MTSDDLVRIKAADEVIIILGSTAVGKSSVAIELAKRISGEIISADSRAFFRGLDITTDKPSANIRKQIPHHLIDTVDVDKHYDAMCFRNDVSRLVGEIRERGHIPIVVGGGTLYLRGILQGIFDGPSADKTLRKKLRDVPVEELYSRLCKVDAEAAKKIHRNDRLRIVRALEVHELTGEPISKLQREALPLPFKFRVFGLRLSRRQHREAIRRRVDRMVDRGIVSEIRVLIESGLDKSNQAYRTIGVGEVVSFLEGKIDEQEMKRRMASNTWKLAKRQRSWFGKEKVHWIDATESLASEVATLIIDKLSQSEQLADKGVSVVYDD